MIDDGYVGYEDMHQAHKMRFTTHPDSKKLPVLLQTYTASAPSIVFMLAIQRPSHRPFIQVNHNARDCVGISALKSPVSRVHLCINLLHTTPMSVLPSFTMNYDMQSLSNDRAVVLGSYPCS